MPQSVYDAKDLLMDPVASESISLVVMTNDSESLLSAIWTLETNEWCVFAVGLALDGSIWCFKQTDQGLWITETSRRMDSERGSFSVKLLPNHGRNQRQTAIRGFLR